MGTECAAPRVLREVGGANAARHDAALTLGAAGATAFPGSVIERDADALTERIGCSMWPIWLGALGRGGGRSDWMSHRCAPSRVTRRALEARPTVMRTEPAVEFAG